MQARSAPRGRWLDAKRRDGGGARPLPEHLAERQRPAWSLDPAVGRRRVAAHQAFHLTKAALFERRRKRLFGDFVAHALAGEYGDRADEVGGVVVAVASDAEDRAAHAAGAGLGEVGVGGE